MTIDERLEKLLEGLPALSDPDGDVNGNRNFLRNGLLEVARDQRHACAEVLNGCRKTVLGSKPTTFIELDTANQAVMNAEIK